MAKILTRSGVAYLKPLDLKTHKERLSNYLNGLHWDFFATLTFAADRSERVAFKHTRDFLKNLEPELAYFCLEHGERLGRLHAHAIIKLEKDSIPEDIEEVLSRVPGYQAKGWTDDADQLMHIAKNMTDTWALQADRIQRRWAEKFGIAKVETAKPGVAGRYLTKYLTKGALENYDFVSKAETGHNETLKLRF